MTQPCQPNEEDSSTHRAGVVVVLCGPDGSGKSSIASALVTRLSSTFRPELGLHCHWKPRSKNPNGRAETRPHDKRVRSVLVSLPYFCYHWIGFISGMLTTVPQFAKRGGMVLIERFYYDFFVDQQRYRLRVPRWIVDCGYWLLPKPDLVFLLDAPPEVLQQRKQEVPLEETARQRQAYRELIGNLPNGRIIDGSMEANRVVETIADQIKRFVAVRDESKKNIIR